MTLPSGSTGRDFTFDLHTYHGRRLVPTVRVAQLGFLLAPYGEIGRKSEKSSTNLEAGQGALAATVAMEIDLIRSDSGTTILALELPGPLMFVEWLKLRPPTDPTAVYEPTVDNGQMGGTEGYGDLVYIVRGSRWREVDARGCVTEVGTLSPILHH